MNKPMIAAAVTYTCIMGVISLGIAVVTFIHQVKERNHE